MICCFCGWFRSYVGIVILQGPLLKISVLQWKVRVSFQGSNGLAQIHFPYFLAQTHGGTDGIAMINQMKTISLWTFSAICPKISKNATWRTNPAKWVVSDYYGDRKSPQYRVVGPLPNGHSWLVNGGYTTGYTNNWWILQHLGCIANPVNNGVYCVVVSKMFIFTLIWGRFPIWLIFFRWVETTN